MQHTQSSQPHNHKQVFKAMDSEGKGYITQAELHQHLKISHLEAKAIIEEANKSIHGRVENSQLTLQDFQNVMQNLAKPHNDSDDVISNKVLNQYRQVFTSLDTK